MNKLILVTKPGFVYLNVLLFHFGSPITKVIVLPCYTQVLVDLLENVDGCEYPRFLNQINPAILVH